MLTAAALALSGVGAVVLGYQAWHEHRHALERRAKMLAEAQRLFPAGKVTLGPDGYPNLLVSRMDGSELALSLIADTLVTRRLPQLWLKLTLREAAPRRNFSLGALARSTGAEFYALTHGMPERLAAPSSELPLIVRGDGVPEGAGFEAEIAALFSHPQLKEAAVTPRGVRIVRQVSQGDRGAHLLLRQARFSLDAVPAETILAALRDAERLSRALCDHKAALREAA